MQSEDDFIDHNFLIFFFHFSFFLLIKILFEFNSKIKSQINMLRRTLNNPSMRRLLLISPLFTMANMRGFSAVNTNGFIHGTYMIPHPEKADRGGEDAFFANSKVLSAADGVGGWASHGINPAHYSRKLCKNVEQFVEEDWSNCKKNPKNLIKHAWSNNKEKGSSTLVVVTIPEDEAKIYASYVGDSGYMILRPKSSEEHELIYASES